MRPPRWLAIGLLALGGCASDPAAGWTTATTWSDDITSIAVPIADNDSFFRGIEFDLTDALIKEIEARTPYTIARRSRADSVLSVHVRDVDLRLLSRSRNTSLAEETVIGVTIDFEWIDQRHQTPLVERRSFTGHSLFVPSAPSGERIELGRFAVAQKLARDVVDEMRAAW